VCVTFQVKTIIERLQDGCERSLQNRDEVHEIKLKNMERELNKGTIDTVGSVATDNIERKLCAQII